MNLRRGDIVYVAVKGPYTTKPRPVVVVQATATLELMESVTVCPITSVEVDADFVDRYLNDGDIDPSELHAPLEQALREGHLIPVCFVSAKSGAGVAELLDVIVKLLPNPTESNPPDFLEGEGESAKLKHAAPAKKPNAGGNWPRNGWYSVSKSLRKP